MQFSVVGEGEAVIRTLAVGAPTGLFPIMGEVVSHFCFLRDFPPKGLLGVDYL